jgi:hypothetical protein
MKDSINGKIPTITPKIRRSDIGVKKLKGSGINWSNPYGDQATHFVDYMKSPNAPNSSYNHTKKVTHLKQDQLCEYHLPMNEEQNKVGYYNRTKCVEMS